MPKFITKRNGEVVTFGTNKIFVSINKARAQTNELSKDEAKKVLDKVLKALKTSILHVLILSIVINKKY